MTPQQLTIAMAGILSLLNIFIMGLYAFFLGAELPPLYYWGFAIIFFVVSYFIIKYLLERYIYRRIKPIYKVIRKSKLEKNDRISSADFRSKFLDNIDDEVEEWANQTRKEIATLKTLEEYRKSYVGNISHELKTPLFSIQGYIHTILDDVEEEATRKHFLERASVNVDRLITIVQDLDTITKLETDGNLLDIQSFNIRELADEVILDLELMANRKQISIVYKDGASKDFVVRGDRENIRQVFTNLILNSIKYGKMHGKTKISFYDLDHYILVEVSDNGIGIENQHLKHLFDRFYRIDKSRSRSEGGSGLGLAIVKHIIEAHGQDLNVRSTIDKGTTFGFTLSKA